MESKVLVGSPAITHLCDVVLETLRDFADTSDDIEAFCGEVRTLHKFLDLIERVFKAKLSRMAFEEQHLTSVAVLLDRGRTTLSRLCEILAALVPNHSQDNQEADPEYDLEGFLGIAENSEVNALRARVDFYIQTLQMSLHTVKL